MFINSSENQSTPHRLRCWPLHRCASSALIKTMSDLVFSHSILRLKNKVGAWGKALAYKIHDGARPKLRGVYCYLTWVTLLFRVKCDAKTRLQSQSESHVLQTAPPPAFSCQAHLDCFTCAGDPVVRCSAANVSSRRLDQRKAVCNTAAQEKGG